MSVALAPAKLNLALVAGPLRPDGYHELVTVYQRLQLADRLEVEPAWRVTIDKEIPVTAGLAGGSSDAATALRLANATLDEPLSPERLHAVACALGADVPLFLADGPQLGRGNGTELAPLDIPTDYAVLLWLPEGAAKRSTAAVFVDFDARDGAAGFELRRDALLEALAQVRAPRDLAALPPNDLARSPHAIELAALGAFRADVTGAGPTLYGLFDDADAAQAALEHVATRGRSWLTAPC